MLTLANAGVPMLFIVAPVLVVALLPIALAEAGLYRWRIGIPWRQAVQGALGANVLSTVVGVPLTWFVLLVMQIVTGGGRAHGVGVHAVTWQAPWLIPYEEHLDWMIPAAGMALCLPFLLASILVECLYLQRVWKELARGTIRNACGLANGLTYGCLAAFWGVLLILSTVA